jgi:hypothetical protein
VEACECLKVRSETFTGQDRVNSMLKRLESVLQSFFASRLPISWFVLPTRHIRGEYSAKSLFVNSGA